VQDVLAVLAAEYSNTDSELLSQILRKSEELMNDSMVLAQGLFDDTRIQPTQLQKAVAIAAMTRLETHPKQIWQFYSGMGKSYIVAAIALKASITDKYSNITIVVPNSFLKSRDHTKFAALFTPSECAIH
jgi:hypothetical protein